MLDPLAWLRKHASSSIPRNTIYKRIDPASLLPLTNIDEFKNFLFDENQSLFERYRAMFALRDIGTDEVALAICEGKLI